MDPHAFLVSVNRQPRAQGHYECHTNPETGATSRAARALSRNDAHNTSRRRSRVQNDPPRGGAATPQRRRLRPFQTFGFGFGIGKPLWGRPGNAETTLQVETTKKVETIPRLYLG